MISSCEMLRFDKIGLQLDGDMRTGRIFWSCTLSSALYIVMQAKLWYMGRKSLIIYKETQQETIYVMLEEKRFHWTNRFY